MNAKRIVWLLAASVGLMMTGFGIIMPVFARRLGELGGGVGDLGIMTMAFACAHMLLAPWAGSLSDRVGRKPFVLIGLAGFALSNGLYLLAPTTHWFIAARAAAGVMTAGLYPAAMSAVDDISGETNRAARVGLVMAGYGVGFVAGPVVGGLAYDAFGFAAPFVLSGALGAIAFVAASWLVPETRVRAATTETATNRSDRWQWPTAAVGMALGTELALAFAFAFVEPQMVFYVYDALGWSTAQFGLVAGAYGMALAIAQASLAKTSDRFGRMPVVLVGMTLTLALYVGLATITSFAAMIAAACVAGLGTGLVGPALSARLLDLADDHARGRILGLKSAAASLGGVLGPLAVAIVSRRASPSSIFWTAGVVIAFVALANLACARANQTANAHAAAPLC